MVGGWRLVAVSGWRLVAVSGWRLVAVSGWRLVAVSGWRLVAVSGWRLVAVSGWRLAVGGWRLVAVGGWRSWGAVLHKKKTKIWGSQGTKGQGSGCTPKLTLCFDDSLVHAAVWRQLEWSLGGRGGVFIAKQNKKQGGGKVQMNYPKNAVQKNLKKCKYVQKSAKKSNHKNAMTRQHNTQQCTTQCAPNVTLKLVMWF